MDFGKNIKKIREERKLTQEQLSEKLGVSFQAISLWERDECKPDTDNLIKLAEVLDVSVSALVEEKISQFKTKDAIYNWEHMKTYVKTMALSNKLTNTLKAIDFATAAHEGQKRKRSDIPYIYHPLNLACHALSMGIMEDDIIAGCLLHDVVEDCNKTLDDLPVDDSTKEIVRLMTYEKENGEKTESANERYYKGLAGNPKAALVKCLDRCNNITTMSWGLSRKSIYRMIVETEKYYPALFKTIKDIPEYSNASWLIRYQMESMLDIYKRLM